MSCGIHTSHSEALELRPIVRHLKLNKGSRAQQLRVAIASMADCG